MKIKKLSIWEYNTLYSEGMSIKSETLQQLGLNNWELVSVIYSEKTDSNVSFWKKEIPHIKTTYKKNENKVEI